MAILKIARAGHPVLSAQAAAVADVGAVRQLLADMAQTLEDAGGVGLAGPQVHAGVRVFIYFVPESRGVAVPLTAVINPVVTPLGDEMELGWEGCLSIPGLRAAVPRFRRVRVSGLDVNGVAFEAQTSGFEARVIQHEADHLDGIMYPSRMTDFRYFGFNEELDRFSPKLPVEDSL